MGSKLEKNGSPKKPKRSEGYKLSGQPSKTDTTLEVTEIFATTVKHVGDVSGVPGLGHAADIVLSILNRIQDMRDNKDEFKQLAQEARNLVESIRDAFTLALDGVSIEQKGFVKKRIQELDQDIEDLIGKLDEINDFALVKAKRSLLSRFVYSRYDIQTIRQYRDAMRHSQTMFNSRTNVVLRVDVANVHFKADQILEAVKRLEQQNTGNSSPSRSIGSSSDLRSRPQRPHLNPFVQNYSSDGSVTVHNTVDNSVHNNSRVQYGDNIVTNNVNYGGTTNIGGSAAQDSLGSPGAHSRPHSMQGFGGHPGSPAQNLYHSNGPVRFSQHFINGPAQFNYDQRGYGYQPPQYGHPPHNQWVEERPYG